MWTLNKWAYEHYPSHREGTSEKGGKLRREGEETEEQVRRQIKNSITSENAPISKT